VLRIQIRKNPKVFAEYEIAKKLDTDSDRYSSPDPATVFNRNYYCEESQTNT
jgi:hypothetical protein